PASTAVCKPSDARASTAGGGITTASSAARDGAEAKANAASAPIAAAQNERRLSVVWRMGSSPGSSGLTGNVGRLAPWPQSAAAPCHLPEDTSRSLERYALADTTA